MVLVYRIQLCFVLLSFGAFSALSSAATLARPSLSNELQPIESSNSTRNQISSLAVDPHLIIVPTFNGPNLDQVILLMSAVQLIAKEATENIDHDVEQIFWASPSARFSIISILVLPPPNAATINRRHVIWGLTQSLHIMMNLSRFASAVFRMTRSGALIGTIFFTQRGNNGLLDVDKRASLMLPINSTNAKTNDTTLGSYDSNSINTVNAGNLEIFCRLRGYDLEPSEIFGPVVTMLGHVAQFPARARFISWSTPFEVGQGQTALSFVKSERETPPFCEKEHIITATTTVPLFMIRKGRFSEVDIKIQSRVGTVAQLLANGQLIIERTPPPHLGVGLR
ncbi:MAG: hypothetical protein Q9195_007464 [Heterodermia aff. obscurata]